VNGLDYLEHIKTKPCLVVGRTAEMHYLDPIGMGRDRKKPLREHYSVIPLSREYHIEIHSIGVVRFNELHNLDVWKEAFNLLLEFFQQETNV